MGFFQITWSLCNECTNRNEIEKGIISLYTENHKFCLEKSTLKAEIKNKFPALVMKKNNAVFCCPQI
jgi:hypothetical protein